MGDNINKGQSKTVNQFIKHSPHRNALPNHPKHGGTLQKPDHTQIKHVGGMDTIHSAIEAHWGMRVAKTPYNTALPKRSGVQSIPDGSGFNYEPKGDTGHKSP